MSAVQLNDYGSPYYYTNGKIWAHADKQDTPSEVILHDGDTLVVYPGTRIVIGLPDGMVNDFDLFSLLGRCEATRDRVSLDKCAYEIDLNILRIIALYYTNVGYGGMNIGEFLRRTLTNGEDGTT